MKKRKKQKSLKRLLGKKGFFASSALVCLVLLGSLLYYSTGAFLKDDDKERNDFAIADLKAEVVEPGWEDQDEFFTDMEFPKKVQIKNSGTQPIFVRVMLFPTFKKETDEGTLVLPATFEGTDPILTFSGKDAEWMWGEDGWYYYLDALAVDEQTPPVLEKVEMKKDNLPSDLVGSYEGAEFAIEVKVEAIGLSRWAYRTAFWQDADVTNNALQEVDQAYEAIIKKIHPAEKPSESKEQSLENQVKK